MSDLWVMGIETSCDETSVGIVRGPETLAALVIHSQDQHALYGGVVPEVAARAHLAKIDDVVDAALVQAGIGFTDLDAIGVTSGPGLIGALLVGVTWARAASVALGIPLIPVHHMEAHLFGVALDDAEARPPFVGLLVSGGHTLLLYAEEWGRYVLLGSTRDDAAGEAFDKVAKILGLGYPGGAALERLAREGDPSRHPLPRPMVRSDQAPGDDDYYDLSFSGLKTSAAQLVADLDATGRLDGERPHIAASFQEAVVDVLVAKTRRAVAETGAPRVLLGGGVSANTRLRQRLAAALAPNASVHTASLRLSLDNGAMVARAALFRWTRDGAAVPVSADAALPFPGLRAASPNPSR
ncbi:MAG: tRNA (adenosine(37)-N6)-threonylcarbamoyltransferase complex transferase subunit TsaD [Gemmatimonadota bacterium]